MTSLNSGLLLNGRSIEIEGVGHVRSPLLKMIYSTPEMVGAYNIVHTLISCSKKDVLTIGEQFGGASVYSALTGVELEDSSKFDLIMMHPILKAVFGLGLSLFFEETLSVFNDQPAFALVSSNGQMSGLIVRDNYKQIEAVLKETINVKNDDPSGMKFASEAARRLWEEQNKMEKETTVANPADYSIPNIISKLSCGTTGYTLFTIYELSVYQLYDQFYSYSQNRMSNLCEAAYAHWGGEDFDQFSWLHSSDE